VSIIAPDSHAKIETLGAADATAVVEDVKRFVPAIQSWDPPSLVVERRTLSCYEDYQLIRFVHRDSPMRMIVGLYAPGDFWPLEMHDPHADAAAGPFPQDLRSTIYHVNSLSPLRVPLTPETVVDYSALFVEWPVASRVWPTISDDGGSFSIERSGVQKLALEKNGMMTSKARAPIRPIPPRVRAVHGVRRWKALDSESDEAVRILHALKWNVADGASTDVLLRRADISFYREHGIYELLLRRPKSPVFQQHYFLHHPDGIVEPLDGESMPIHRANARESPLFASERDVADYLRFFCWAIRADDGRFLIVEHLREIPWERAPDGEDWNVEFAIGDEKEHRVRQRVISRLKPLRVTRQEQSDGERVGWRCTAVVSYGRTLFSAVFQVFASGLVRMLEDEQFAGPLRVSQFQPARLSIERTLTSDDDPIMYFDSPETTSPRRDGGSFEYNADVLRQMLEALS